MIRCGNPQAESLWKVPPGLLVGRNLRDLMGDPLGPEVARVARRAIDQRRVIASVSMFRGYWARGRYTPMSDGDEACCVIAAEPWSCPLGCEPIPASDTEALACHDLADLGALTSREAEVLWRLTQAKSVPEIAREIFRSVKTVEAHIRALSAKTGRSGRLALAQLAIERNLVHMTHEQVRAAFG